MCGIAGIHAYLDVARAEAHHLAGQPHHHRSRRNAPALGHEAAGGNNAFFTDLAAGKEQGAHPDQRLPADAGAVQDGSVAHDHAFLNYQRGVGVGMSDAAVLEVAPRPERDPGQVAANDGTEPDVDARR